MAVKISTGDYRASRVAQLSRGQLDCLRLVNEHHSSKEIAAALGISPHTVDQRIRGALQILGVERRSQAARLVAGESISTLDTSIAVHCRRAPRRSAGRGDQSSDSAR